MGAVLTRPDDLPEVVLTDALRDRWRFTAMSMEYQAVGFGSHHWLATDARGARLFATVDDLAAKLRTAKDTTDAAFDRLDCAFVTALTLRAKAGLAFVIAPIPGAGGQVLARLSDRYSLVVHPYITGTRAGENGEFANGNDRRAVLDMLVQLHRAHAGKPLADDFVVPHLDALRSMLRETGATWQGGPYAQRAHELLSAHARELDVLLTAYRSLARRVATRRDRLVITHGEPHAGNVISAPGGLVLVDWDTVLLAPPERDLWDIADHDESILDRYASASGVEIDQDAMSLYRLWYDLAEIGGYLSLFRTPHGENADTAESWRNLNHFLRPAQRWPALYSPDRTAQQPDAK